MVYFCLDHVIQTHMAIPWRIWYRALFFMCLAHDPFDIKMGMSCDMLDLITRFLGLVQSISIAAIDKNSVHFGLWTGSQIRALSFRLKKSTFPTPNRESYSKSFHTFYLILKGILKIKIWIYYHWIKFAMWYSITVTQRRENVLLASANNLKGKNNWPWLAPVLRILKTKN